MPAATTNLDAPYLDRIEDVAFQPVFIIGPHRSGTTILYKILLESGCFNGVTAYYVVNRDRLLQLHFENREQEARRELSRLFDERGLKDREFDSMKITPDIPEEYCFALEHQGRRPILSPRNMESFLRFCRKLQIVQKPHRPLLLKNPFDTVNFVEIHRALPDARFLFIYRDPIDVISSQIRSIRSIISRKNEYVALVWRRYRELYENPIKLALARGVYCGPIRFLYWQVAHNVSRNCDYVLGNVDKLGEAAYGLGYRELCESPNETVRGILDYLDLEQPAPVDFARFIRTRSSPPPREVERGRAWIHRRTSAYRERFGLTGTGAPR